LPAAKKCALLFSLFFKKFSRKGLTNRSVCVKFDVLIYQHIDKGGDRVPVLDHTSYIPLYAQIINYLDEQIESGFYQVGQQIPSENALASELGVSRITVTNAINRMVQEGTLYRIQGKGTFVADKKKVEHRLTSLLSFTTDMASRGYQTSSKLVSFELTQPPEKAALRLGLAAGQLTWRVKRVRYADNEPMAIQTAYLPEHIFPAFSAEKLQQNESLYKALQENYQIEMLEAEEQYNVMVVRKEEDARLLNVASDFPALYSVRVSSLKDKRIFEYTESILRGDRYVLSVKMSI